VNPETPTLPTADEASVQVRRERAVREKPMRCPADPDPHFLADCFDATHAAMLNPAAIRAKSHDASGKAAPL
jgi:hypothetical protein